MFRKKKDILKGKMKRKKGRIEEKREKRRGEEGKGREVQKKWKGLKREDRKEDKKEDGRIEILDEVGDIHGHFEDLGRVELLNLSQHAGIIAGHEVDRHALASKTTTTSNTMDVVLLVIW